MARRALMCSVVALLLAPPAWAGPGSDAARARAGLDSAVRSGWIAPLEAEVYKGYVSEAEAAAYRLSGARGSNLSGALATVAAQSTRYDLPRAVALFEMLRFNTQHLGRAAMPPAGRTLHDADGIAYRAVPGLGLQYHPLATFGRLNADVTAGRYRASVRLAYALMARARPSGGALVWETYYRTSGGYPPWTSGMTQAVAAQAFARVGFVPTAKAAYRAVPNGHLQWLPHGPWVRLYHFNGDLVLNAQLQTAISLAEYGRLADDAGARELAAGLRQAAASLLPRFDTGDWSLYALGGGDAELTYHGYVASLLWKLERRTGDPFWGRWALKFRHYWRLPPAIKPGPPSPPTLPVPADGFRDTAHVRFWISKPATVTLHIAGEKQRRWFPAGTHDLAWSPGARPPGEYNVRLTAVDRVGNVGSARLAPIRVERDTAPPELAEVALADGRVTWAAKDPQTPWLALRIVLRRGGGERELPLGRRAHDGAAEVELPAETCHATFVAADSAGNETLRVLGTLNRPSRFAEE